jgi:hypothetical protein
MGVVGYESRAIVTVICGRNVVCSYGWENEKYNRGKEEDYSSKPSNMHPRPEHSNDEVERDN